MSTKVIIYTTEYCPYCSRAKQLLTQRGVPYEERRFGWDDDQAWNELYQRSKMRTVPQIFFGDELIGGYQELAARDQIDRLESLKK